MTGPEENFTGMQQFRFVNNAIIFLSALMVRIKKLAPVRPLAIKAFNKSDASSAWAIEATESSAGTV